MVGGQHHLPGVLAQQEQLESDPPLQGMDVVARPVRVGHDPAAGLHLGVVVDPLAVGEVAQQRRHVSVGRHRQRRAEHHLADVGGDLGMRRQVLEQLGRAGARLAPGLAPVAVELQVGEVRLAPGERAHRVERRVGVAGDAEVVGVNVDGCGSPSSSHGAADRLQHLARGHLEARHLVVEASRRGRCVCFQSSTPPGLTSLTP